MKNEERALNAMLNKALDKFWKKARQKIRKCRRCNFHTKPKDANPEAELKKHFVMRHKRDWHNVKSDLNESDAKYYTFLRTKVL